ncbi:hypothetical protein AYL99_00597 [Fonsecaea erecta]|uniref:MalT-like TPR region domain-containing protein n=1 Tax=Fonsecaea erecta TaxID=1367422 RepID=A0A179A069_9EURO|nr:hypothetical protein AYL99_00597 [Fonsecaea erecta]OAP64625.1 hypothetical protein AYL99_00597 [Fonsecaea erecta]
MDTSGEQIASILRLYADKFGPASGLDFDDALRIALWLTHDPGVPSGVHITALQMIARQQLKAGDVEAAEPILRETLRLCDGKSIDDDDDRARFLQQTLSDMGYMYGARRDRAQSAHYYGQALDKAIQVQNTANVASIRCRIQAMADIPENPTLALAQAQAQPGNTTSSALWAFCRPYS